MRKKIGTLLDEDILVKAKLVAVKEGKKLTQVFEEAVQEYVAKREYQKGTRMISRETKGALKAGKKLVRAILKEELYYEI